MADLIEIGVEVRTKSVRSATKEVDSLGKTLKSAERSASAFVDAFARQERQVSKAAIANKAYSSTAQKMYNEILKIDTATKSASASASVFAANLDKEAKAAAQVAKENERLKSKFVEGYTAMNIYTKELNELAIARKRDIITADQQKAAVAQLNAQMSAGTGVFANAATNMQLVGKRANRSGVLMQQAGYQFGDFAVQVQSGTNVMVAFGQQATQLIGTLSMLAKSTKAIALFSGLGILLPILTGIGAYFIRTKESAVDSAQGIQNAFSALPDFFDDLSISISDSFDTAFDKIEEKYGQLFTRLAQIKLDQTKTSLTESFTKEVAPTEDPSFMEKLGAALAPGMVMGSSSAALDAQRAVEKSTEEVYKLSKAIAEVEARYIASVNAAASLNDIIDITAKTEAELALISEEAANAFALQAEAAGITAKIQEQVNDSQNTSYKRFDAHTVAYQKHLDKIAQANTSAQQELDLLTQKNVLLDLELQYGKDSSVYKEMALGYEEDNLRAKLEAKGVDEDTIKAILDQLSIQARLTQEIIETKEQAEQVAKETAEAAKVAETLRKEFEKAAEAAMSINIPAAEKLAGLQAKLGGYTAGLTDAQVRIQTAARKAELAAIEAGVDSSLELAAISSEAAKIERETIAAEKALKKFTKTSKEAGNTAGDALTDAEQAAVDYAKALDGQVINAVDGVANAWSDFVMRGFKDFSSFKDAIINSFKNMIGQMIAMAAKNQIMLSLGIGGVGATMATTAAASAAGAGAIGGTAGASLLAGGGILAGTGIGSVVSGIYAGGATALGLGGAASVGTAATAAGATAAGTAAMSIASVAVPLLAVAAAFSFFKKRVKELDNGLRVTVDTTGTLVETFKTLQTKRFFGLSKKVRTNYEEADAELADPVADAVGDIQQNILDMASTLGVGSDAFTDFAYQFDVSLKGLTEDQKAQKLNEEFLKLSDAFAELTPEIEEFRIEGETTTQTLARLSGDLKTVNAAFSNLGRTALSASADAAAAASRLVSAAGGQGAFVSKTQTLVSNILDPSEQLDFYQKKLVQESQFGYVPSEQEVKRIFQSGSMEELETLYGGQTIGTLNTIFGLQNQIAQAEEQRLAEKQRAEAAAAQAAARAASEAAAARKERQRRAAAAAQAIVDERLGLEGELLELQGNTAELRRRELEALDPTNRALQQMIWKLEDAKEAIEGITEVDFATLFDYQKAVAMARISSPANVSMPAMPMVVNGSPTISPEAMPSNTNEGSTSEEGTFVRQSLVELIKYSKRTSDTLRKFDFDGLPPERT